MGYTQYVKLLLREPHTSQHKSIAAQCLDRIDTHTAHKLLELVPPCCHKIDKSAAANIGVEPLYQFRTLCSYAPVAFSGLAGAAKMAEKQKKRADARFFCFNQDYFQDTFDSRKG